MGVGLFVGVGVLVGLIVGVGVSDGRAVGVGVNVGMAVGVKPGADVGVRARIVHIPEFPPIETHWPEAQVFSSTQGGNPGKPELTLHPWPLQVS